MIRPVNSTEKRHLTDNNNLHVVFQNTSSLVSSILNIFFIVDKIIFVQLKLNHSIFSNQNGTVNDQISLGSLVKQ